MRFVLPIFLLLSISATAQDTVDFDMGTYKESSIAVGYSANMGDPTKRVFHLIQVNYWKSVYNSFEPIFFNWHAGTDIGLNTESFLVGPRIGGIFGMGPGMLGVEMAYYTDFTNGTLRFIPFMGFGFHYFKLSAHYHLRLSNKDFEPINRVHLNLTIPIISLKKERLDLINETW